MKYVHYKTDGTSEIIETVKPIAYEQLRELVGGDIEFYRTQNGEMIYLNESGRLIGLESNPFYFEDIRGNTLEIKGVDHDGESMGWDSVIPREAAKLPDELFQKGNKFTIIWISDSWGATVFAEIVTVGRGFNGGNIKPAFKLKGKRKEVGWSVNNSEIMIFRGHDLPIKDPADVHKSVDGVFVTRTMRMNSMFNVAGLTIEEMRDYIEKNQINPFFIRKDHILFVSSDNKEILVFPDAPATTQRIANMQSAQLNDGISRTVIA